MQAKQSSTASGMHSRSETRPSTLPIHIAAMNLSNARLPHPASPLHDAVSAPVGRHPSQSSRQATNGAGLLHDARNLMGAIELYCDLLSLPDVLKPDHRHYAEELRLLGSRGWALIQQLIESGVPPSSAPAGGEASGATLDLSAGTSRSSTSAGAEPAGAGMIGAEPVGAEPAATRFAASSTDAVVPGLVSLRTIVERCSGLFSQVANGRVIEVSYGPAASAPISVDEEAVERILVNLVRNSAAALDKQDCSRRAAGDPGAPTAKVLDSTYRRAVIERIADGTADETPGAIRIGVGLLVNRADDPGPLPRRRLRLTVEDCGCGMTTQRLRRLLSGSKAPSRIGHGIGFRVVRDLVANSCGDLRVMSFPGIGTRVQIEWPVATKPDVAAIPQNNAVKTASRSDCKPVSGGHLEASEQARSNRTTPGLLAPHSLSAAGRAVSRSRSRPVTPGAREEIRSNNEKWAVC